MSNIDKPALRILTRDSAYAAETGDEPAPIRLKFGMDRAFAFADDVERQIDDILKASLCRAGAARRSPERDASSAPSRARSS
jgi:hypothetical protein